MSGIPGADERRREQERIRKEYPDLYYYAVGVALVVALIIAGYALFPDRDGYLTNLFTEATSVAVTLVILNRMAEARERRRYKQDLIYRMGSQVNAEARRAVEELRQHGWLTDGSLRGASLVRANLTGANLREASLESARLEGANLERATLVNARLQDATLMAANLQGASLVAADLSGANLWLADISRTDFYGANLQGAHLWQAKLDTTDLIDTTLPNGDKWHLGYDMSIFTNLPDDDASDQ